MKKTIAFVMVMMFLLSPSFAFANEKYKPVKCFPLDDFYKLMENKFGEKPAFILNNTLDINTTISLLFNKQDGTWTLVEHDKTTVCILGMGKMPTV